MSKKSYKKEAVSQLHTATVKGRCKDWLCHRLYCWSDLHYSLVTFTAGITPVMRCMKRQGVINSFLFPILGNSPAPSRTLGWRDALECWMSFSRTWHSESARPRTWTSRGGIQRACHQADACGVRRSVLWNAITEMMVLWYLAKAWLSKHLPACATHIECFAQC